MFVVVATLLHHGLFSCLLSLARGRCGLILIFPVDRSIDGNKFPLLRCYVRIRTRSVYVQLCSQFVLMCNISY